MTEQQSQDIKKDLENLSIKQNGQDEKGLDPEKQLAKKKEREKKKEQANFEKMKKLEEKKAKLNQQKGQQQGQGKSKKQLEKEAKEKQRKMDEQELESLIEQIRKTPEGIKKEICKDMYKTYQPKLVETAWYSWWEKQQYFKASNTSEAPNFTIVIPPPNVTGSLHIGHSLVLSLQDCVIRYRKMKGCNTLWLPGTDHAGIATQVVVERKIQSDSQGQITRSDLGRQKFLEEVFKWVDKHGGKILEQFKRMGCALDWSRYSFTLDDPRQIAVKEAFNRLFEQGLIYRDNRLVNWSCTQKTAISDIEVEYLDIEAFSKQKVPGYKEPVEFGVLTEFAYELEDGSGEIVVATTRLETMIGDTAVAVHPNDESYKHVHGKFVKHPIPDPEGKLRKIPIILDAELVDMEFGTGAVKITPAHDPNDFSTGKKHNLQFINVLTDEGNINEWGGKEFQNMPRFKARVEVEKFLDQKGLYKGKKPNPMRLGICSKSKDIVEPRLKPQWWVSCKNMANQSIEAVKEGKLQILPKEYERTWFQWLENIRDWCISRQLWWGHQVPAYYVILEGESEEESGKPGLPSEKSERWVAGRSLEEAEKNARQKFKSDKIKLVQDEDVLDTWFSSGLFPLSTLGWPQETADLKKFYPTQTLITGHDILFFWVARMVMMGLHFTGEVPFKTVYLSPMIRDAHGRKMSKSLGNVVDPIHVMEGITLEKLQQELLQWNLGPKETKYAQEGQEKDYPNGIDECGTDAIRFALINYTNQGRDVNLDIKRVVAYRHWCNKIWNAIKFGIQNLQDFDSSNIKQIEQEYSEFPIHCKWILSRLSSSIEQVDKSFDQYNFYQASQAVYAFLYDDLFNVFLEATKPTFYFDQAKLDQDPTLKEYSNYFSPKVKSQTQYTLYICLESGLRLLHPFMPFITEETWQRLPLREKDSISQCSFPHFSQQQHKPELESMFKKSLDVIGDVRGARNDQNIQPKATPDAKIEVDNAQMESHLQATKFLIKTLAQLNNVDITQSGKYQIQLQNNDSSNPEAN